MKIGLKEFLDAFKVVDCVDSNVAVETSTYFRITAAGKKLTLDAVGNLRATSQLPLPEECQWTGFVGRDLLSAALRSCKDDESIELTFDGSGKSMTLRAGGRKIQLLSHSPISGYAPWKASGKRDLTEWVPGLATLRGLLPTDPGNEHLEAVYFRKGMGILATNSIFLGAVLCPSVPFEGVIPASMVKAILRFGGSSVCIEKDGTGIILDSGYIYQPTPAPVKKYPIEKVQSIIEAGTQVKSFASVSASELNRSLEFLGMAPSVGGAVGKTPSTLAKVREGNLVLSVDLPSWKAEQKVPLLGKAKTDAPEMRWPLQKLRVWTSSLDADDTLFLAQGENNCTILRTKKKAHTKNFVIFANL
jgi:hypothetical protein